MRLRALVVVALLSWAPSAAAAKDTWITLRTQHLTITSNAGEGATRDAARRLERFVDALTSLPGGRMAADVPVNVVVFRSDAAFRSFLPRENGRTLDVSGYFQRADDEHVIALSLENSGAEHPLRVVFHEYAHALMARAAVVWPLWLTEGLAEFYSTFEAFGDRVAIGLPIREYGRLFQEQALMPLEKLFTVDRRSSMYTEGSRRNIFYAESWLVVHYLLAADGGRRQASLARFIEGLDANLPPDRAFAQAVGEPAAVDDLLRRYVRTSQFVPIATTRERQPPVIAASIRTLSDAETEVVQGNLLMRIGRASEADAYFARARALDPAASRLDEAAGFLELNRGRYELAVGHLARAIAREPSNALAHYYYAETLRRQVTEQGRPLTPAVAGAMVEPLRTAVRLRPDFARAHYVLGYVYLVGGIQFGEGVRAIETAIRLLPPYRAAMLTLASLHLKMGNHAAARATAQAVIDAPDAAESIKTDARQVLAAAGTTGR